MTDQAPKSTNAAPLPWLNTPSLADRTRSALVRGILEGTFDAGRFPAENELATMLGVSRTTVRAALQSLEQVGMIERRPGRGTRVRKHASANVLLLHGLVAFSSLLDEQGYTVESRVTWERFDALDEATAARLGVDAKQAMYEVRIVLLADGKPAVSIRERFPAAMLVRPLEDVAAVPDSVLKLSAELFVRKIDHALAQLIPRIADKSTIVVPTGEPYLFIEETFYASDDTPIAVSDIAVNDALVHYAVVRRFTD